MCSMAGEQLGHHVQAVVVLGQHFRPLPAGEAQILVGGQKGSTVLVRRSKAGGVGLAEHMTSHPFHGGQSIAHGGTLLSMDMADVFPIVPDFSLFFQCNAKALPTIFREGLTKISLDPAAVIHH